MKWRRAQRESKKCKESIAVTLKATSDRRPPPDANACLMCKIKVRKGQLPDSCTPSDCPKQ